MPKVVVYASASCDSMLGCVTTPACTGSVASSSQHNYHVTWKRSIVSFAGAPEVSGQQQRAADREGTEQASTSGDDISQRDMDLQKALKIVSKHYVSRKPPRITLLFTQYKLVQSSYDQTQQLGQNSMITFTMYIALPINRQQLPYKFSATLCW